MRFGFFANIQIPRHSKTTWLDAVDLLSCHRVDSRVLRHLLRLLFQVKRWKLLSRVKSLSGINETMAQSLGYTHRFDSLTVTLHVWDTNHRGVKWSQLWHWGGRKVWWCERSLWSSWQDFAILRRTTDAKLFTRRWQPFRLVNDERFERCHV